MYNFSYISSEDCAKLAAKIRKDIYKPAYSFKTTIFLCGAEISNKNKLRYKISKQLRSYKYFFKYDIIYPEDIFDELLYSSKTKDVLSLESLLADSVDSIVLIPESPGSFAELGTFSNDIKLRKKMICIVDKKYRKKRSYINQGPLKLIKKEHNFSLLFIDPNNIEQEILKLTSSLAKIKKESRKRTDKISLLQLENFLLPCIFLLEPVPKETLVKLVSSATKDNENAFQTTTAALTILTNKRLVELTTNGYKLTLVGIENFLTFRKTRSRIKNQDKTVEMDDLRLEIFNFRNRKKRLRV